MSIRFAIKNTQSKAEKEGEDIVRYTGVSEPFRRTSQRDVKVLDVDKDNNPIKWKFTTGLDEDQVQFYKWYDDNNQKALRKYIQELKPIIASFYGGDDVISSNNYHFWRRTTEVNKLSLTNENMDLFMDTKNPAHALLYLSISAGAFIDLVAPTKEWAESHQLLHYMALETDEASDYSEEEDIKRSDAHMALGELRKEYGKDALYILAWCIQYDTAAFGAYSNSTPEKDLINYHIKYIDGKISTKRKKDCPRVFLDYANKWKGQQTKPKLYTEAYVKAGVYFGLINQRDKKFVTSDGTILGNTISEAVDNMMSPKFTVDLQNLREKVEKKWNE